MRTLVLTLVAAACALLVAPAAEAHGRLLPPRGKCGAAERNIWTSAARQKGAMRCLVTHARRQAGQGALRRSWRLDRAAALKARRIVACRRFSHTPCGRSFLSVFRSTGYGRGSWSAGEVIGSGAWGRGSARNVFHRWLHSSGHRATIIRRWKHVGVARRHVRTFRGQRHVSVWVATFGRP